MYQIFHNLGHLAARFNSPYVQRYRAKKWCILVASIKHLPVPSVMYLFVSLQVGAPALWYDNVHLP